MDSCVHVVEAGFMQIGWSTLAFASGTVATTVVAVTVMSLNSQPVRDNAFHVCVAKDRVLRLVDTDEPCPEGQERLRLAEADTPDVEPPNNSETKDQTRKAPAQDDTPRPPGTKPTEPEEREFKKVERPGDISPVHRVRAPFEVVDASGRVILRVGSLKTQAGNLTGLGLFDPALQAAPVALMLADRQGNGTVRVESPSGQFSASMAAFEGGAGFRARKTGDGIPAAAVEITGGGKGKVAVGDGSSEVATMVARPDSRGQVEVSRGSNNLITLTEGAHGGLLQIASKGGTTMVEAGVEGSYGVVRAGPQSGPALLLPGGRILVSRLVGKQ
jgi:hypothetical protein